MAAGPYNVIYADPPWQYGDKKPRGGAERHYPTMPLKEICALPISRLAADSCALFIWATWPLLPEALQVISAWGFEYKTLGFDWVKATKNGKEHVGLGRYNRGNTEPCLLAVKGRVIDMVQSHAVRSLILGESDPEVLVAPIGAHSAKPAEARDRIVTLLGDMPRVELFARQQIAGWDCWGNQVTHVEEWAKRARAQEAVTK